jgi:hypothetical protein
MRGGPTPLERLLDGPEKALLWLPWASTARIILKGSFGFLRQILRSRGWGASTSRRSRL